LTFTAKGADGTPTTKDKEEARVPNSNVSACIKIMKKGND
jgi:hypothetical protein